MAQDLAPFGGGWFIFAFQVEGAQVFEVEGAFDLVGLPVAGEVDLVEFFEGASWELLEEPPVEDGGGEGGEGDGEAVPFVTFSPVVVQGGVGVLVVGVAGAVGVARSAPADDKRALVFPRVASWLAARRRAGLKAMKPRGDISPLATRPSQLSQASRLGARSRNSCAFATASVRRCTCSFSKMRRLCPFTVSRARKSRAPIS